MRYEKKKKDSKIKLEDLKVQSFVTELEPEVAFTAKGGETGQVCSIPILSNTITSAARTSNNTKWPCKKRCEGNSSGGSGGGNPNSDPNSN